MAIERSSPSLPPFEESTQGALDKLAFQLRYKLGGTLSHYVHEANEVLKQSEEYKGKDESRLRKLFEVVSTTKNATYSDKRKEQLGDIATDISGSIQVFELRKVAARNAALEAAVTRRRRIVAQPQSRR